MHFGATLRMIRTATGMSLTSLASHVGVSPAYLSRVEHGHDAPPTADRIRAIAGALRLPPDALADLVEELRPDAAEWLGHSAAGRQLAAELRRRDLGPAQLARVAEFVRREFPIEAQHEGVVCLFGEQRILHGVRVPTLRDALEIAAVRLVSRAELPRVVAALAAQAQSVSGSPQCAIGGGLCVAHARAAGHLRGVLLLLVQPVELLTPDEAPVQAVVVVVGPDEAGVAGGLARVARIAAPGVVGRLCASGSAVNALGMLP